MGDNVNNKPGQAYSFELAAAPMHNVWGVMSGLAKEIFQDHAFKGTLEKIVLDFTVKTWKPGSGRVHPGTGTQQMFDYMPIIYRAFGKPKKFLFLKTDGPIASGSVNILPEHFGKSTVLPAEFVDFAVSEANALAKTYHLPVQVVYHGDPLHARKYLPQEERQQSN